MADYTQITSFAPKDALTTGDPNKKIRGSQLDPEFSAIATAIQSKFDSVDVANNTEAAALSSDSKLITPAKLSHALQNATLTLGANISVAGTATFPNVAGAVTSSHTELNILDGVTATAAQINTLGPFAYKTASTTRASTTTLADDPHLTVSVAANSVYAVELFFHMTGSQIGSFKFGWTVPSGSTSWIRGNGLASTGTTYESLTSEAQSANVNIGNDVAQHGFMYMGQLITGGNAGTFAFRWSQLTSDAAGATVSAGAWIKLRKIA